MEKKIKLVGMRLADNEREAKNLAFMMSFGGGYYVSVEYGGRPEDKDKEGYKKSWHRTYYVSWWEEVK